MKWSSYMADLASSQLMWTNWLTSREGKPWIHFSLSQKKEMAESKGELWQMEASKDHGQMKKKWLVLQSKWSQPHLLERSVGVIVAANQFANETWVLQLLCHWMSWIFLESSVLLTQVFFKMPFCGILWGCTHVLCGSPTVHPVCFWCQDSRDWSLVQCQFSGLCVVTPAECNARSFQLANVTFSSPHAKQLAINRNIAMSLPMHIGNDDGVVAVRPCSSDHWQWSATASTARLGSWPVRLQIWACRTPKWLKTIDLTIVINYLKI